MGENRKLVDIVIARARDDGVLDEDGDGRSGYTEKALTRQKEKQ